MFCKHQKRVTIKYQVNAVNRDSPQGMLKWCYIQHTFFYFLDKLSFLAVTSCLSTSVLNIQSGPTNEAIALHLLIFFKMNHFARCLRRFNAMLYWAHASKQKTPTALVCRNLCNLTSTFKDMSNQTHYILCTFASITVMQEKKTKMKEENRVNLESLF